MAAAVATAAQFSCVTASRQLVACPENFLINLRPLILVKRTVCEIATTCVCVRVCVRVCILFGAAELVKGVTKPIANRLAAVCVNLASCI